MQIQPTDEQQKVVSGLLDQINSAAMHYIPELRDPFVSTVAGYAGTGKTSLISFLRKDIAKRFPNINVAFLCYTGKAASVLKSKLEANYVNMAGDYVGTIHGLIYKPETKYDKKLKCFVVTGWKLKKLDEINYDLFIIDEGSMVSKKIWNDLNRYNRPIIVVGDHGQLPPIDDDFNLMKNPTYKLKTIHRQALNSPIIQLSQFVRQYGYIPFNRIFSKNVFKLSWNHPKCKEVWNDRLTINESLIILCGFNTTRCNLNNIIRERLGHKKHKVPIPGERVVCLKNNHDRGIMNGQQATLLWLMPEKKDIYRMTLSLDDSSEIVESVVSTKCFGEVQYTMYDDDKGKNKFWDEIGVVDYFDYGYAMSVHKSQGSEWDRVVLFEQRASMWDDDYYARWLYTGITRARNKLFIISDYWG